jgi:ornithine lipid ester-linked acyl 2-hydroxylase
MSWTEQLETWHELRRKYVKRYGKRAFRRIDHYLAQQSLVPDQPVLDARLFPWMADLEANWQVIRAELDALLLHREKLPRFQDISPDQKYISPDDKWKIFVFYGFSYRSERNCQLCPATAALLERVPNVQNAFFSILAPGKQVPSHRGITKGLIRCHLGLKVPVDREHCVMEVGGVRCTWREGEVLVFDDLYPHEVHNDTPEERVVLLLDFPRPMTRRGILVRYLLMQLMRRTAYVRDAVRNERHWEEHFF